MQLSFFDGHRTSAALRRCGRPSPRVGANALTSILLMAAALGVAPPLSAQTPDETAGPRQQAAVPAPSPTPGPITGAERLNWILASAVGPASLATGAFSAGWSTAWNTPPEYGAQWKGFGKRYGIRFASVAIGTGIEGALGAAWGEDPRYPRFGSGPASHRVGHALKLTVMAPRRDGQLRPAYARYVGTIGNNFVTNEWRPDSHNSTRDAIVRSAFGFAGRFAGNLFAEFGPDMWRKLARRK